MDNGYSDFSVDFDERPVAQLESPHHAPIEPPQANYAHAQVVPHHLSGPPMPPPPGMGMSSHARRHALPTPQSPPPMHGMGVIDTEIPTGHLLGMSVLLPAAGTILGLRYGGLYGSLGGALIAGSLINVYRAARHGLRGTPEDDKEAVISGTYAVAGIGASIWLFMKSYKSKAPKASKPVAINDDDGLHGVE